MYFSQCSEGIFVVYLPFSIRIGKGKKEGKWGEKKKKHENRKLTVIKETKGN